MFYQDPCALVSCLAWLDIDRQATLFDGNDSRSWLAHHDHNVVAILQCLTTCLRRGVGSKRAILLEGQRPTVTAAADPDATATVHRETH